MIKTGYILLLFICIDSVSLAQNTDSYYGMVITKITKDGSSRDTSKLLYCRNKSGSMLSAYTVREEMVGMGTTYKIHGGKDGLYLYSLPTLSGQAMPDSLRIDFKDSEHAVLINKNDKYILYPAYYTNLKQEVVSKHSVIALLGLLDDAIGDYRIEDALPLLRYTPQLDKHILKAKVVTQRSQADMLDTWVCTYQYNKIGKLIAVSAVDGELIRFSKKIIYKGAKVATILTFLNIEDRQVTDRTISYNPKDRSLIKWRKHVLETGENRETDLTTTFIKRELGMFRKIDPSPAEILNLFKTANNNGITKKYVD